MPIVPVDVDIAGAALGIWLVSSAATRNIRHCFGFFLLSCCGDPFSGLCREGPVEVDNMAPERSAHRRGGQRRWNSQLVGNLYTCELVDANPDLDGKKVSIEGMLFDSMECSILMNETAGSALIQACEKAGVTIPR